MQDPSQPGMPDERLFDYRRSTSTSNCLGWLVAVGAFYIVCNISIAPLTYQYDPSDWPAVFVFAGIGVIFSQGGLVAIWGVFGTGSIAARMAIGFGIGILFYAYWMLGLSGALYFSGISRSIADVEIVWKVLLCLPLVYLSIQFPLWIAKVFCRWTIERSHNVAFRQIPQTLTIRKMMLATGMIAGSLGAVRLTEGGEFASGTEFWIGQLIAMSITVGFSLVSTIPTMAIMLRARNVSTAIIWLCIYCVLAFFIYFSIRAMFSSYWGRIDEWEGVCFVVFTASFGTWLAIPLWIVRRGGYQLRWGKESETERMKRDGKG